MPASPTQPPHDHAPAPFVGRDAELATLLGCLDLALAGAGRIALLTGEPGIGKTRTTEQLVKLARERGAMVLWGGCYEWEGAPSYWPWTQVLRAWLREVDDNELWTACGPDAGLLAQIVPDLPARLPDLPPAPELEPEARLFRLLAAAGTMIRAAAESRPLVIVLDDIHWADVPSLQLLRYLAQEIRDARLLVIATFREAELHRQHPGAPILADLAREPHCTRVVLRGLSKPHVARFAALVAGAMQPQPLVDAIYAETGGNPFFVVEVVRLLAAEGHLGDAWTTASRPARVPESVREAVGRRLDRLSPACNGLLATAAIIGREFEVRLLERATGEPPLTLLERIDEAVRARLVEPGDTPGIFRFSHAIVQETLAQELAPAERARLHLDVGQALAATMTGGEPPWAALAHHFAQAAPLANLETVCEYASRAGGAAMQQFAWEAAAGHFRHALDALDWSGSRDDVRRCDLLLALGEAQNRAGPASGDAPEARASFARAFELARSLGDAERMARAAVGFPGINIVAAYGGRRQLQQLEAALERLDPADSPLRVRLLSRLAVELWNRSRDDLDRPRAVADEAIAVAQRLGDPMLIAHALWARIFSSLAPNRMDERAADAEELIRYAELTDDPLIAFYGYLARLLVDVARGNLARAEEAMTRLRHYDERAHIPYVAQRTAAFRAMLALLAGRYAEAEQLVERARDLWQSNAPRQHQSQAFVLCRDLGRLDELTDDIQIPDGLHLWRFAAQAHRMALNLERGRLDAARPDYEALIANDILPVAYEDSWCSVVACLTDAVIAYGDTERAKTLSDWMMPYAGHVTADGTTVISHGPVALHLGRLAALLGRWGEAEQRFQQALAISERGGMHPYVVRALLGLAEVYVKRNSPGDREQGQSAAQRAVELATSIGMHGVLPRAVALRDAFSTPPVVRFGLTPRELDVLRLVTQGLSDADVAERLSLSRRTINSHLTSIYAKLDVPSRTAAAHWAVEHDVV